MNKQGLINMESTLIPTPFLCLSPIQSQLSLGEVLGEEI